jgi:hypothetical protein
MASLHILQWTGTIHPSYAKLQKHDYSFAFLFLLARYTAGVAGSQRHAAHTYAREIATT